MSQTETPKPKKPRGAPKSMSEKLTAMADAKRKQVEKLAKRYDGVMKTACDIQDELTAARSELAKLESAIGAAS
jgi:hypothetical protein